MALCYYDCTHANIRIEHNIHTAPQTGPKTNRKRTPCAIQTYWIGNVSYSAAKIFTQIMKREMFLVTIAIDFPLPLITSD